MKPKKQQEKGCQVPITTPWTNVEKRETNDSFSWSAFLFTWANEFDEILEKVKPKDLAWEASHQFRPPHQSPAEQANKVFYICSKLKVKMAGSK